MSSLSLRNKLLLLALLPLLTVSIVLMLASWTVESDALESEITNFREKLLNERRQELVHVTEVAKEIVSFQRGQGGDYKAALRDVRFGSAGYFFVYDGNGKNLFHALLPNLEGTDQIGMTDPKGTKIIVGLLNAARNGDGILTYYYQKPGTNELVEKIGYAAMIPGTDWIIGTGAYVDDIEASVAEYRQTALADMEEKLWLTLMIVIVITLITAMLILFAAQRTVTPIRNMLDNLNDIAQGEGDLTKRLQVRGEDEIAQLGQAFNRFVDKLQRIIRDVTTATHEVQDAAGSIHSQTQAIAAQLANHNNETDQVVTAITEMSSTAQEVAMNTTQVAEATHTATDEVAKAQECVDTSLTEISTLMAEINSAADHIQSLNEQSQKINSVLSVIGGIAEQTNLLALNAAIEAARAGEQGRGFAVVADEVRSLASRTQASTLEINEMLSELHRLVSQAVAAMEESQQSCHRSVESSRLISESLGAVTSSVTSINDMSTQIATAATEQSSVTEEINRNVYAIQEIVAELLHSSEEAARVSQTVSHSGDNLGQLVNQFRV
ncbi:MULTISPECIES: methyl-accepting chemotaxis protein [Shewanella]|uniref:Methyl-accepting chemotaxis sensory transducer with Cache sensor n=1 Tax=Shewanella chilikensis TaxID=558541 RepID=A0ABX5PSR9_9GAMM|nr:MULTISPECIES: methyl-accepting chemotaxis protein [Shewanella]MBZ4678130.1 methyl-accepting chemotaxis protein [Shewanella sp.]MCE9853568.1 methyl-accepting chemotaxis protein [Shewanella chilikensis]MCL1153379.1 methyl-accepting chemotaxis protein [Shewanella chilikensis]MCL1163402.1 methyl-accepting chemotaxis protein [Shewanella chilikensis]PYE60815.1 methyl-accepting chemotaxis sensory transducer with Cache sensor [Shewanella chilikensis]